MSPLQRIAMGLLIVFIPAMFEIGAGQGPAVERILARAGFGKVEVRQDLAGLDRLVVATHS